MCVKVTEQESTICKLKLIDICPPPLHLYHIYLLQELMVPMNDIDIYDGESIDGSLEAKSKNNWVQIFDMIDLTFNNLQQQNKELKRTVNELSSKVNKVSI